ncbi:Folliculinlike, partial [Caligus rogercresseyi]
SVIHGTSDLERGGPLLVGDQRHLGGRSLFAFTFYLRDAIYSFFILLRDHFWLLSHLQPLHHFFKNTASKFQARANKRFDPKSSRDEDLYLRLHKQFVGVLKSISQNFRDTIHFGYPLHSPPSIHGIRGRPCIAIYNLLQPQSQTELIYGLLSVEASVPHVIALSHSHARTKSDSNTQRPSLSEDLILKKLHHIREDIFGLSKVIGSVILGGPYPGDSKLKAILASMNLVFLRQGHPGDLGKTKCIQKNIIHVSLGQGLQPKMFKEPQCTQKNI